ncbi:MAG: hypothetical protein GC168_06895 [Candidatus Hydrogenedens sp.]|nr:hypothetical protein [Candidatus Hydrogenedens sp.]
MNTKPRIAAMYSRGTHYPRLLRFLRNEYPGCELTAVVPPAYPERLLEGQCDRILRTEREQYGLRDLRAILTLLSTLRAERFDALVVMFNSVKLRLLASGAGAASAYVFTADRRFFPVTLSLLGEAWDYLARNLRGRITYAYIAWVVKHQRVGK